MAQEYFSNLEYVDIMASVYLALYLFGGGMGYVDTGDPFITILAYISVIALFGESAFRKALDLMYSDE